MSSAGTSGLPITYPPGTKRYSHNDGTDQLPHKRTMLERARETLVEVLASPTKHSNPAAPTISYFGAINFPRSVDTPMPYRQLTLSDFTIQAVTRPSTSSTPSEGSTGLSQGLATMEMSKDEGLSPMSNSSNEQERPATAGTRSTDPGYVTADIHSEESSPTSSAQVKDQDESNVIRRPIPYHLPYTPPPPVAINSAKVLMPPMPILATMMPNHISPLILRREHTAPNLYKILSKNKAQPQGMQHQPGTTSDNISMTLQPPQLPTVSNNIVYGYMSRAHLPPSNSAANFARVPQRPPLPSASKHLVHGYMPKTSTAAQIQSSQNTGSIALVNNEEPQTIVKTGSEKPENDGPRGKTYPPSYGVESTAEEEEMAPEPSTSRAKAKKEDREKIVDTRQMRRDVDKVRRQVAPKTVHVIDLSSDEDADDDFMMPGTSAQSQARATRQTLRKRQPSTTIQRPKRKAAATYFKDHESGDEEYDKAEMIPFNGSIRKANGELRDNVRLIDDDDSSSVASTSSSVPSTRQDLKSESGVQQDEAGKSSSNASKKKKQSRRRLREIRRMKQLEPDLLSASEDEEDVEPENKMDVGKVQGEDDVYFVHRIMAAKNMAKKGKAEVKMFHVLWWNWNLTSSTLQSPDDIADADKMFAQFEQREEGIAAIWQNIRDNFLKYGVNSADDIYEVFERKQLAPPNVIEPISDLELKEKLKKKAYLKAIGYWSVKRTEIDWLKIRDPTASCASSPLYIENWGIDNENVPDFRYIMDLKISRRAKIKFDAIMRVQGSKCKYSKCGCFLSNCRHGGDCIVKGGTRLTLSDNYTLEKVPDSFRQTFFYIHGCSDKCPCDPATCKKNILKDAKTPPMVFYEPHLEGYGVRALTAIKKGQLVANYAGEVILSTEIGHPTHKDSDYTYSMSNNFIIDALRYGNEGRFFSQSCGPNLFCVRLFAPGEMDRVLFFAKRDIEAGEELTIDYHPDYITADPADDHLRDNCTITPEDEDYIAVTKECKCLDIYCRKWL